MQGALCYIKSKRPNDSGLNNSERRCDWRGRRPERDDPGKPADQHSARAAGQPGHGPEGADGAPGPYAALHSGPLRGGHLSHRHPPEVWLLHGGPVRNGQAPAGEGLRPGGARRPGRPEKDPVRDRKGGGAPGGSGPSDVPLPGLALQRLFPGGSGHAGPAAKENAAESLRIDPTRQQGGNPNVCCSRSGSTRRTPSCASA